MKGPYANGKVYAIAAVGRGGFDSGVLPAVYAHDSEYSEGRFFTIGQDQAAEAADRADVLDTEIVGELILDSSVDPGYAVPDRQVLSLWSQREEALVTFKARSERGKAASQSRKDRVAAETAAKWQAIEAARAGTAEGQIEALPGIMSINRVTMAHRKCRETGA